MARPRTEESPQDRQSRKNDADNARKKERVAASRDIGPLPPVADPARRARCEGSLLEYCRTYFPKRFKMAFAECHLTMIAEAEEAVREGSNLSVAMPRGSGKTAIAECAILWAICYGLKRFAVLVQATKPLAGKSFKKIKREIERNPLLAADFPEVCYPIARLARIHNRAHGQTLDGIPTDIEWTADQVTLPTVPGAASSGATICVCGIESASRGLSVSAPDGSILRPDLVLVDDAQTRESAKSAALTDDRENLITDDIMGMVGPGETMTLINLCTVIFPGDLADRFLSVERHPEFRQVRVKLVEQFPDEMALWDEYWDVRRAGMQARDRGKAGNEFLRERFEQMHKGAKLSWPDRKVKADVSGLQTAMNKFYSNRRGFFAECQNDPQPEGEEREAKKLVGAEVTLRLSNVERGVVPVGCSRVTAFVDVHPEVLWFAVVAWNERFGGSVIDYGTWPRQSRGNFSHNDLPNPMSDAYPKHTEAQRVFAGLTALFAELLGRPYEREAGGEMRVERCLCDCNWQPAGSKAVFEAIRRSRHAALILPSRGLARSKTSRGVGQWKVREGERGGPHWRLTQEENAAGIKVVQFDPDHMKSVLHQALTVPLGGAAGLTLFGRRAAAHQMLGDHCEAETAKPVETNGDRYDKWAVRPDRPDNHLFDCLAGNVVAAMVAGVVAQADHDASPPPKKKKRRVALSEVKGRDLG